jgi:hypothetical protein
MAYTTTDLLTALGGKKTFSTEVLPESKDFEAYLIGSDYSSIMKSLLDRTKDALLLKAYADRKLIDPSASM